MASPPTLDSSRQSARERRLGEIAQVAVMDIGAASALAAEAKSVGITSPLVHYLLGIGLRDEGRYEDAIVELGEGLKLDPKNVQLLNTIGFCLLELNRRQEAAHVFEAALLSDPKSAEASYGYGWSAERLGALEQAQAAWERAAALDPKHAHALAGLSGLAVRRRDWESARSLADRAVALDPRQTDAIMNLARVDLGQREFEAAKTRIRRIIALPALPAAARANAWIMLGDALDGAQRYAEAFAAYAQGKAELRTLNAPDFEAPGRLSATRAVQAILAEFRGTEPSDWSKSARLPAWTEIKGHAFLVGFPRSGTTLLEQILATHPDVVTLEERPVLLKAELEFLNQGGGIRRLAAVFSDFLEPFQADYWRRVKEFGVNPENKVFIDKQPLNTFRLPLISKIFPAAKIIFAIRDPRDVTLSCFRRSFNMNASMYEFNTIVGAAQYYAAVMESGETYLESLPLEVFRLRYEDLVADFGGVTGRLCDFLGLDRTEALERFSETAASRMIATPSSTQVGRGLYDDGVDQWRRYADALRPAMSILAPWVEKFGYAPS
jgi:tetratricopeptide (TPR) repeat protein